MEAMRTELAEGGREVNVVAINVSGAEDTQGALTSRSGFDLLQDTTSVNAWQLLGGAKDDIFIYRQGGALSPGGYLPSFGEVDTNLSTGEGYRSVFDAIVKAHDLGPGRQCGEGPAAGSQRQGNVNQDSRLDLTDAVVLLGHLFQGAPDALPCEGGRITDEGNLRLLDVNGDLKVDLSDPVYFLKFLFGGGPLPAAGTECVPIAGCPDACGA
jgi:hypothetical protein